MEKLYATRDAFFWWAGVWGSVTLGNRAISKALSRRRRKERKCEYAQWRQEFAAFLFSEDARPEGAETGESEEPEAATETEESAEQPETTNGDGAA